MVKLTKNVLLKFVGPTLNEIGWIGAIYEWWVASPPDLFLGWLGCIGAILGTILTVLTSINGNGENKK